MRRSRSVTRRVARRTAKVQRRRSKVSRKRRSRSARKTAKRVAKRVSKVARRSNRRSSRRSSRRRLGRRSSKMRGGAPKSLILTENRLEATPALRRSLIEQEVNRLCEILETSPEGMEHLDLVELAKDALTACHQRDYKDSESIGMVEKILATLRKAPNMANEREKFMKYFNKIKKGEKYTLEDLRYLEAMHGIATFDYKPIPFLPRLSLTVGEDVVVTDDSNDDWYIGYKVSDPSKIGTFPRNHVKMVDMVA